MEESRKYTQEEMITECNKNGLFIKPLGESGYSMFAVGEQIGMTSFAIVKTIFILKDNVKNVGSEYYKHVDLDHSGISSAVNDVVITHKSNGTYVMTFTKNNLVVHIMKYDADEKFAIG